MSLEKMSLSSPTDMVTAVPYLLGFHPDTGSVVTVAIKHHRIVTLARIDLPTPDCHTDEYEAVGHQLTTVIGKENCTSIIMIGYGQSEHIDAGLFRLRDQFDTASLSVIGVLRVTGDRVFSIGCTQRGCCPAEGTPVDLHASRVAVQATVMGLVALPDRDAVVAKIKPVTGEARAGMRKATQAARTRLDSLRASGTDLIAIGHDALEEGLGKHSLGQRLDDDQAAWLTVLLGKRPIRDDALLLTGTDEDRLAFWTELTRRAEDNLVAGPAVLLAVAAWRWGDGPLAAVAIERAFNADPADSLITVVAAALETGIAPHLVEQAIQAATAVKEGQR